MPFEPVTSSALVAETSRKPPKDHTPVLTRQINGIKSFLTCYFLTITDHLLVHLCINHTDRYHSFFVNMLHCYYLLPAGADQCVLSKKIIVFFHFKKGKCQISSKTCDIKIVRLKWQKSQNKSILNLFCSMHRFFPAKYITSQQCTQPPGCGTNPYSK